MLARKAQCARLWGNMTSIKQVARMGGRARWKDKTPEERSEAMKKVRRGLSTTAPQNTVDKQARL